MSVVGLGSFALQNFDDAAVVGFSMRSVRGVLMDLIEEVGFIWFVHVLNADVEFKLVKLG